jgi:hypothetical protein
MKWWRFVFSEYLYIILARISTRKIVLLSQTIEHGSENEALSRSELRYEIQGVHFKTQSMFYFVILQCNKTWSTVYDRCWKCPPFSWTQTFTNFTIFCRWTKSSIIYACSGLSDVAFFSGTVRQHTSVFHATDWSTAWGTAVSHWSISL